MLRHASAVAVLLILSVILVACPAESPGADATGGTTVTSSATASVSPSAEATENADAQELPPTEMTAVLGEAYATEGAAFDPADLGGIEPGDVEAHWYTSGDTYVVAYVGVDLEDTGPLCPGNSLLAEGTFSHITNAPTEEGACGTGLMLAEPPLGVYLCGPEASDVLYHTAIPADAEGEVFGSIENPHPDGYLLGITSTVATGGAPEIDLDELGCEPAVEG